MTKVETLGLSGWGSAASVSRLGRQQALWLLPHPTSVLTTRQKRKRGHIRAERPLNVAANPRPPTGAPKPMRSSMAYRTARAVGFRAAPCPVAPCQTGVIQIEAVPAPDPVVLADPTFEYLRAARSDHYYHSSGGHSISNRPRRESPRRTAGSADGDRSARCSSSSWQWPARSFDRNRPIRCLYLARQQRSSTQSPYR